VLVNFDADRATAAAEVLRDFAARGHQLLVFTCHEHIEEIFNRLEAPLNRLPSTSQASGATIAFSRAVVVEEPKREKPTPPARRKPSAKAKPIEEVPPPDMEEYLDEETVALPIARPVPLRAAAAPPPKKRTPPKKKAPKSSGVFDADFFESEAEADDENEFEEIDGDGLHWEDEENQGNGTASG
jgi:hypothetical protein